MRTPTAFYFINIFLTQNLIADLYLLLILTPKEQKTSIVYMSDVRIQYNFINVMPTVCGFTTHHLVDLFYKLYKWVVVIRILLD